MKFLVKRMGGNQQAAEEVFSHTVIASWQGWHAFRHKSSYFTWICRIALNKMADYYRQEIHRKSLIISPTLEFLAEIGSQELLPEERLALDQLRLSVRKCLNLLPEERKKLLYLRYWRDMSIKKIAQVLGVSERSAEGRLYRARIAFRQILIAKYPFYTTNHHY